MLQFTDLEKRWLEIVFYLLCNRIYINNYNQEDIINFIKGYRWTNLFNYDKLENVITKDKILLNNKFIPTNYEINIVLSNPNCRMRIENRAVQSLTEYTQYKYTKATIYNTQMKNEINPIEVFPQLNEPNIHATLYSFLISLRYIADIVKTIKY